jgi:SAM-dependent methyltransferase
MKLRGIALPATGAHFRRVLATDASLDQLGHAQRREGVTYHAAEAARSGLRSGSVDLVSVAQAMHWFDLDPFYEEVRRVLRPGGVLSAWTYERFKIDERIDERVDEFAEEIVGPYWPPERRHVDSGYASLEFPFASIPAPQFVMRASWDLDQLLAYVGTWSASRRFWQAHGFNPTSDLDAAISPFWGERQSSRPILWRLSLKVGRV